MVNAAATKMKRHPSEILSFIRRQKTVVRPNRAYINWLLKQYRLTCEATVIKAKDKK